eukprot:evm.model.scf_391EXC.2 EVM.evm.TU.scf_391EXC.2   scf_391EXC:43579-43855(+)
MPRKGMIGDGEFVRGKGWRPIARLEELDAARGEGFEPGLPQIRRMEVLERDIAVWKDAEGCWRAVEDRCPHKGVALSLGRVREDGTLECRFH